MDMRVGMYPGVAADDVRHEVEACVAAAAKKDAYLAEHPPRVEWVGHFGEGYELTGGDDLVATLSERARARLRHASSAA